MLPLPVYSRNFICWSRIAVAHLCHTESGSQVSHIGMAMIQASKWNASDYAELNTTELDGTQRASLNGAALLSCAGCAHLVCCKPFRDVCLASIGSSLFILD